MYWASTKLATLGFVLPFQICHNLEVVFRSHFGVKECFSAHLQSELFPVVDQLCSIIVCCHHFKST